MNFRNTLGIKTSFPSSRPPEAKEGGREKRPWLQVVGTSLREEGKENMGDAGFHLNNPTEIERLKETFHLY